MAGARFAAFTPEIAAVARLTLVADPDELLTEPGIIEGIREHGFELITFEDHVAFRYAYETRFRRQWDEGRDTHLVVVLRAARATMDEMPYDLLEMARREHRVLSFSWASCSRSFSRRQSLSSTATISMLCSPHIRHTRRSTPWV